MISSIGTLSTRFGAQGPDARKLAELRDELIQHFPSGLSKHSNGSSVGFLEFPHDRRIGICITHATEADKQRVIQHLIANNIITQDPHPYGGTYKYKDGALVSFKVRGSVTP